MTPAVPNPTPAVADARSGEFDRLYEELQPSLWRYAFRLVGDSDVADDVVQEAFLRLYRQESPLVGKDARLWLFTVVTNLIRDRGRTASRRRRLMAQVPVENVTPARASERLEREERVAAVRHALSQLAERDQQMLLMREEGFRYHEIAEAVQVAPGSVGTLIARAVKRFTEVYEQVEG